MHTFGERISFTPFPMAHSCWALIAVLLVLLLWALLGEPRCCREILIMTQTWSCSCCTRLIMEISLTMSSMRTSSSVSSLTALGKFLMVLPSSHLKFS